MLEDQDLISIQEVRGKVEKAYAAWQKYRAYSQEQVDAIVEAMAAAARQNAHRLAQLAVDETGYGNAKDKLAKNMLSADLLPRRMRGIKTVGILRDIPDQKLVEIGVSMGVVAAILPTTNPTSTAIYKVLISLKAGNAIVLAPHPRAKLCTCETANVLYDAAIRAGAPEDIIQCIANPSIEATHALMKHERTGVILSTGGSAIVKAAYSSGKPAFGVGPGNVAVLLEKSADLPQAIAKIVEGKSFDYGTLCSSEQTIVAEQSQRDRILAELKARKAFLCDHAQTEALGKLLLTPNWTVNPKYVGQAPGKIAQMAGFTVPGDTSILVVEIGGVGKKHPLSAEKLSPVLAVLFVPDFAAALASCEALLRFGGLGHTCVIHSNDDARIREYALRMPAFRVLVNTPAPQGSTGITTNVFPAMTLGCGAVAGNSTSDNVGPLHLINIKRLAYAARTVEEAFPASAQPPAGSIAAPTRIDRQTVVSAVERYLSKRGFEPAPPARNDVTSNLVDRFLTSKRGSAAVSNLASQSCPIPTVAANEAKPVERKPAEAKTEIAIVPFVCENDVRAAIEQGRKIYISPKSIVTPSARDLAAQHDILILAERS